MSSEPLASGSAEAVPPDPGLVASTIARKAPCSVLVISPDAALEEGIAEAVEAQTPAWHREPAGVL